MSNRCADRGMSRWAPVRARRDILLCASASAKEPLILRARCHILRPSRSTAHSPATGGCNASAKAGTLPKEGSSGVGAPVYSAVFKLWNESRTNRARIADSLLVGFVHGDIS